jgi:pyroglutamyl-peptidase
MILVTGFEPFGGMSRNPSAEAARAVAGPGVRAEILPVDFAALPPALEAALGRGCDAALLCGVAVGRDRLSLERVAINYRDPTRRDERGALPGTPEVVAGGPAAYFASIPVDDLRSRLEREGLPAEVSLSAGAYLCNAAFYLALHLLGPRRVPCGFLHLPAIPGIAGEAPSMPLEEEIRGLSLLVGALRG